MKKGKLLLPRYCVACPAATNIEINAIELKPYKDTALTCLQLLINACGLEFEDDDPDLQRLAVEIIANTLHKQLKILNDQ